MATARSERDRMATIDELCTAAEPSVQPQVRLVLDYLLACEEGRLDAARGHLSSRVRHTFPGGKEFADLAEWFAYFRSRMSWVRKRDHEIDVCLRPNGEVVIYVRGRLEGETASGARFDDVRFIDRFVVSDGQIVDQQVWNDLAVRRLEAGSGADPHDRS